MSTPRLSTQVVQVWQVLISKALLQEELVMCFCQSASHV